VADLCRQVSAIAWAEVKRLTFWRRPLLRWLVGQVQWGFALREAGKSGMVASLWPTREYALPAVVNIPDILNHITDGEVRRWMATWRLSGVSHFPLIERCGSAAGDWALMPDDVRQHQS
jgi:hypothetical protein